jgi:acyl-coenzyme A thioesterase PaaI-like protein
MSDALRDRLAVSGTALARLAAGLRALVHATVTAEAPPAALAAATDGVEHALAALAPYLPAQPAARYPASGGGPPGELMPFDPVVGRLSPLAPPVEIAWRDGRSQARVVFDAPYEGPPGCVHGGILAAVFDQIFNVANLMAGVAGPTARLELRYRRPTPLRTPVVFEGWIARTEGRRVHTEGRLRHGDEITVHAAGEFVQLPPERLQKLLERT